MNAPCSNLFIFPTSLMFSCCL